MKSNRKLQVFLSYTIEDREYVKDIYKRLQKEGFKPWMDVMDARVGEQWEREISNAIKQSDAVLICLSTHSVNKIGFFQKELRSSLDVARMMPEGSIFVIPVRLSECQIPESLSHIMWVDLFKDGGWAGLLASLDKRFEQVFYKPRKPSTKKAEKNFVPKEIDLLKFKKEFQELFPPSEKKSEKPKPRIFIAMPFNPEMEDTYYYGILRAVDAVGFGCYRSDKNAFVGDILNEIRQEIESSIAVVADMSDSNPNVYLEVGFAWGKNKPTVLIMRQGDKLRFDVQGQKCLHYSSIRNLEEILTRELIELKKNGTIQ